jgi:hypothetical protein
MKICGLSIIPSIRTFDRRLASLYSEIKNRITRMGELFVREKNRSTGFSTDSTLIKVKGSVWHKYSMKKKVVPRSAIDTDVM